MAFIEVYAERHEVSKSQALRRILHEAEIESDGQMKRDLALRRVALASEARKAEEERPVPVAKCPSCGDTDLFIQMRDGWRCDNCLSHGIGAVG
jgi:tRNA(Ile2) C34 agmatinyltransferase TiaS